MLYNIFPFSVAPDGVPVLSGIDVITGLEVKGTKKVMVSFATLYFEYPYCSINPFA